MKKQYRTPNKYREHPETDEMGVVKGTDVPGAFIAGAAVLLGLVVGIAGLLIRIFS